VALSTEEVRKIAQLARLELTDAEVQKQGVRLNELLQRFEELKELDVEGIEPTAHCLPVRNVFREDAVRPSLSRADVLANAPDQRDGCFIVPRILGD
jgi:aspartyl-tRNA(Asn)/glutamyl-tRNA(Gln) amidotransferase subunit C